MDPYCKVLNLKRLKLESLLILTKKLKEATENEDLKRIAHFMDERQVLMSDIDVLDRKIFEVKGSARILGNYPVDDVKNIIRKLTDVIKSLVNQITIIDHRVLNLLNQSKIFLSAILSQSRTPRMGKRMMGPLIRTPTAKAVQNSRDVRKVCRNFWPDVT